MAGTCKGPGGGGAGEEQKTSMHELGVLREVSGKEDHYDEREKTLVLTCY